MKRKVLCILLLGISILMSSGWAYAGASSDLVSQIRTDVVDIELEEFEKIGGFEVEYRDNKSILPGDKISKIPRIYNVGMDCYVRVKISLRSDHDCEPEGMAGITLVGMDEKWILSEDGYYYYTTILDSDKTVDLFQEVWIPEDLPQECMGKNFYLDIVVEAIQSTVVSPDYSLESPWGDVEISDQERGDDDEIADSGQPGTSGAVKTGDEGKNGRYVMVLAASLMSAFLIFCGRRKSREEGDG